MAGLVLAVPGAWWRADLNAAPVGLDRSARLADRCAAARDRDRPSDGETFDIGVGDAVRT
ncbi:MAG: hypothetical protein U1E40_09080 [Amaricoccus sp.]